MGHGEESDVGEGVSRGICRIGTAIQMLTHNSPSAVSLTSCSPGTETALITES